jgi:hypothetical protein
MSKEKSQSDQAEEAFKTWRENNPDATKESAQKVWRMYNHDGKTSEEDIDKTFPSGLKFRTSRVDDSPNAQEGGIPKKDAPAV